MEILSTKGVQFPNGMPQVMGARSYNNMVMQTSDDLHMTRARAPYDPERVTEGFAAALTQALSKVEKLDVRSKKLTSQAVYDPDSVDVHNLIVAGEKARFALNLTKTMADGLIRSYRELTSLR